MKIRLDHAIGRCGNCGFGIAVTGAEHISCPSCGQMVHLHYVIGTHNERMPCDDRCQYATGPNCSCSCGGSNHGAGYIPVDLVPEYIRDADFQAMEAQKAKAARAAAAERDRKARAKAALIERHPLLGQLAEIAGSSEFVDDMIGALDRGSMSPRQIEASERCVASTLRRRENEARWESERREAAAAGVTVPQGKVEFTGVILKVKTQDGLYGKVEHKMLVQSSDGWKVWGTVPASLKPSSFCGGTGEGSFQAAMRALEGQKVTVAATVKPSDNDPLFGYLSRPKVTVAS